MSATTLSRSPMESVTFSAAPGTVAFPLPLYRRRTGRLSIAVASVLAAAMVMSVAFYATLAWMFAHPNVAPLASNPMKALHLAYSDVVFPDADNRSDVSGWWIPSAGASAKTVVLSHGYGTNREESWVSMYNVAGLLHGLGYNVLMFDYGYADEKHRLPATGGVNESRQLIGALQFARAQGSDEIVVWGFSMGAGTALQAALDTDLIDGMILDSTFIPDADTIYDNVRRYVSMPKALSVELLNRFIPAFSGVRLNQIPAGTAQSTEFEYPVLVIYGTADDKAPASISENVAAAQRNPNSQLWIVPGALHEMIFRMHPKEYTEKTSAFLRKIDEATALRRSALVEV
ncbi:alpha/beta hydrolase [Cohnella zeiphila]|uniref:Alpha/beta hydrolase n=1 Tax=Cohnella zeiphila TaxID=2761120 RepID=A0A7X0SJS9_9BACL|nr:alpha/beta hydrolase [Cohnella zeiphila]MBB6731285.1 alpha/beta hydrolase [Cohnella zeiphila]